ncbi:MAG: SgcJ/EcaC family oxidoreductase [Rhodomicrobiaceae bacterium]
MTEDERAIRDLVDTWLAAWKAGDLATVLSLMSDDVIFMVPGQEPFGKQAFAAASEGAKIFASRAAAIFRKFRFLVIGPICAAISR